MKFGPVPVTQAVGKVLGHNIPNADGRHILRKGKKLTGDDVRLLMDMGRLVVYVAEPEPGDIGEDEAAERIARSVCGEGIQMTSPYAGRVNLLAQTRSVLRIDSSRLDRINECEGITLATLSSHIVAQPKKIVATVKVIPFALPGKTVLDIEAFGAENGPVVQLYPLQPRRAALILSSSPYAKERVIREFTRPLRDRIESLGSELHSVDFIPLENEAGELAMEKAIRERIAEGMDIIILAGETAIMDRYDIAPRAVERAGGKVVCYGAPVDPGNLLMLAYLGKVPIIGAPGCVRSKKTNVVDWVLPPLLACDHLSRKDIIQMGHGGLLEDIPNRPVPRE